ncbi:MAG: hypothetical protein ABI548_03455 [Polyangiaceae bacterium]
MIRPSAIYFGLDGGDDARQKVYLRTLLYATAIRGVIVESMYVRVKRGESSQNFSSWHFGVERPAKGSGMFVDKAGVIANHHFVMPPDGHYVFLPGRYTLDVHATLPGKKDGPPLHSATIELTAALAKSLEDPDNGVYFDWGPDSNAYHGRVVKRRVARSTGGDAGLIGLGILDGVMAALGAPSRTPSGDDGR